MDIGWIFYGYPLISSFVFITCPAWSLEVDTIISHLMKPYWNNHIRHSPHFLIIVAMEMAIDAQWHFNDNQWTIEIFPTVHRLHIRLHKL